METIKESLGIWQTLLQIHLKILFVFVFRDGDELKKSLSELADNAHTKSLTRISSGSNPFLDIAHDPNAAIYKTGFLARKIHADMDGKKSKLLTSLTIIT